MASVNSTGEDFYKTIKVPKFVNFTVSDHYIPDDWYWFRSRVGCKETHPEEMDPDVIYKNFVVWRNLSTYNSSEVVEVLVAASPDYFHFQADSEFKTKASSCRGNDHSKAQEA
uniref:Uncharacterized protein n=1 Tax=Cucumis sativus TaxID=3659 RepID=A0A0A0LPU4_CUCSA